MTYRIGAYYFGGWVIGEPGITWRPNPWAVNDTTNHIYLGAPQYAERRPAIGYFNEAEQWTMDWSINKAADFGIDFFAFCTYWSGSSTFHQWALRNFLKSKFRHRMKFCLLFANHARNSNDSQTQWRALVDFWIANYLARPEMLTQDGKPVVIIFGVDDFFKNPSWVVQNHPTKTYVGSWVTSKSYSLNQVVRDAGNALGGSTRAYYECNSAHTSAAAMTTDSARWTLLGAPDDLTWAASMKWMMDDAKSRAAAAGIPGIYFVGCSPAYPYWISGASRILQRAGFDAVTNYRGVQSFTNHNNSTGLATAGPLWETFDDIDYGLRSDWDWALESSGTLMKFWPQASAGFDVRPWRDPALSYPAVDTNATRSRALGSPTAEQFDRHVKALQQRLDQFPVLTDKTAIIYAWNEIGEGAYIAPSVKYGERLIKSVRDTFGVRNPEQRNIVTLAGARRRRSL
jgi:hypothetical protein